MTWPQGLKCVIPRFQEKPRVEPLRCPYRKPTQVGEENILRRVRELWLRNSANYHRNFGRRWAWIACRDLLPKPNLGRREMAVATVYQKHRTLQSRQDDV